MKRADREQPDKWFEVEYKLDPLVHGKSTAAEAWQAFDFPTSLLPSDTDQYPVGHEEVIFLEQPVVNGNNFAVIRRIR